LAHLAKTIHAGPVVMWIVRKRKIGSFRESIQCLAVTVLLDGRY
jgi:hypothetical protein